MCQKNNKSCQRIIIEDNFIPDYTNLTFSVSGSRYFFLFVHVIELDRGSNSFDVSDETSLVWNKSYENNLIKLMTKTVKVSMCLVKFLQSEINV